MKMKLLSKLSDERKMKGAIFTTFSFDPPFYEGYLKRIMARKGISEKSVIMLDSWTYDSTFEGSYKRARQAGETYHLSPIKVPGERVFHPKVFFLVGERRAYTFLGSANLTQKGIADNAELVSYFEHEKEDYDNYKHLSVIKQVKSFLSDLIESDYASDMGEVPKKYSKEILDECDWLKDERTKSNNEKIKFAHNLKNPIFNQLKDFMGEENAEEILLTAPYYGEGLQALEELEKLGNPIIKIYLQQNKTSINSEKLKDWVNKDSRHQIKIYDYDSNRFSHGKLLLIKTDSHAYCLTGSPNMSYRGMLSSASKGGNIETGLLRRENNPNYFDSLFEEGSLNEKLNYDLENFKSSSIRVSRRKDQKSDKKNELKIMNVTFKYTDVKSELSLHASLPSNFTDNFEGSLIVKSGSSDFSIDLTDRDLNKENNLEETISIVSENQERILQKGACKAILIINGTESNPRWIDKDLPSRDKQIRDDADSLGTTHMPDEISKLFNEDLRKEFLSIANRVARSIRKNSRSDSTGSEGTRRVHPPTLEEKNISMKDPKSLIEFFYNLWYQKIASLTEQINYERSEDFISKVDQYLSSGNKWSANLMVVPPKTDKVNLEGINPKAPPRGYYRKLYAEEKAVIPKFCLEIVRESGKKEDYIIENIYDEIFDNIFPKVLFSTLVVKEEESKEERERYYRGSFERAANACLRGKRPTPELLTHKFDRIIIQLQDLFEEAFQGLGDYPEVEDYIKKTYLNEKELRDFLLDFYASMLSQKRVSEILSFYKETYELINENDIDNAQLLRLGKFSGHFAGSLKDTEEGKKEKVSEKLEKEKEKWKHLSNREKQIIENV